MIIPFGFLNKQAESGDTDSFISTWETTTASETVVFPLRSTRTYDITINWGDGEADSTYTGTGTASISHVYATAGSYNITVSSNTTNGWKGIYVNNSGDKLKIKDIVKWGTSAVNVMNFDGSTNLKGGTANEAHTLSA